MAEALMLGQPLKFWVQDHINQVSERKMGRGVDAPTYRKMFVDFVTQAYQQEGTICALRKENSGIQEEVRGLVGEVADLTYQVQIRNEVFAVSPEALNDYITKSREALQTLQGTDVPGVEIAARARATGIRELQGNIEVAEGYLKIVGPLVEKLEKTAAAVLSGAQELESAQKRFEEDAQVLRDRIVELERDGLPAHTDEIKRLMQALQEKTEEFDKQGLEHQALGKSAREAQGNLEEQVARLEEQVEKACSVRRLSEEALGEQQKANDEIKRQHAQELQEANEAALLREQALQKELVAIREENTQFAERVQLLEAAPAADVQHKAEMLDRVALAVLGAEPDFGQLEARVNEQKEAERNLGQLYDLARIPIDGGAFAALVGVIQSVARIFTTWGRPDAESLAAYAAHIEPNVAELNRKAEGYDDVVLARDHALGELAESKKLLSILGNGLSWTWNVTTVVPGYVYDAMRF